MFNFFTKYKQRRRKDQWVAGYNWAAGSLLRNEETIQSIESYRMYNDLDAFDLGADAAIKDLIDHGIVKFEDYEY
jgi:hypothetical protein